MTDAIVCHIDLTEITGWTKNGTWQTVDLTPFLQHPDPKIVSLKLKSASGTVSIGAKPVGSAISDDYAKHDLSSPYWCDSLVMLDDNNQIQLTAPSVNGKVYLEAEFGGNDVYAFSDWQSILITGDAWVDWSATSYLTTLDDPDWQPGGQFSILLYTHTPADGIWAYRPNGSVYNVLETEYATTSQIGCVQFDETDTIEMYNKKIGGLPASLIYGVG